MLKSKFSRISAVAVLAMASFAASAADNSLLTVAKSMSIREREACIPEGYGWALDMTKTEKITLRDNVVMIEMDKMASIGYVFNDKGMANDVYLKLLEYDEACAKIQLEKAIANAQRSLDEGRRENAARRQKQSLNKGAL